MIKLRRQEVTIVLENNTKKVVRAWVCDNMLCWHKDVTGQWVLTHFKTGYKLTRYTGKYSRLREITKDVILLSNWQTTDHKQLRDLAILASEIVSSYQ